MSITAQKYLVAALSLALFAALVVVGGVDARRRAAEERLRPSSGTVLLNPQLARGRQVFLKYSCNACHGVNGEGGISNLNSETGGKIDGLTKLNETFTTEELVARIQKGVPEVGKEDPTGPDPPLRMPSYQNYIAGQEMQDLTAYLTSLGPKKAKGSEW
jgi:mono/diheme cytochrome c family protein